MSILIDELLGVYSPAGTPGYRRVNDKYYIAKECDYYGLSTVIKRIKDAFRVLTGKSRAYHYWEDEHECD